VNEGASRRQQRRFIQPELTRRRIDGYVESMVGCVERALPRFLARGSRSQIDVRAKLTALRGRSHEDRIGRARPVVAFGERSASQTSELQGERLHDEGVA
jgi:hypothetical protein